MNREELDEKIRSEFGPSYLTCIEDLRTHLEPLNVSVGYSAVGLNLRWEVPGLRKKINIGKIQVDGKYPGGIWIDQASVKGQTADLLGLRELALEYEKVMEVQFANWHRGGRKGYKIEAVCQTAAWLEAIEDFIQKATAKLKED